MIEPSTHDYAFDAEDGVATITLNRPQRLNALTFEVYDELRQTFEALDQEPGVRAIVLTGSGRAFCSGGDVEEIIGPLFERDFVGLLDFTRRTGALILAMLRCRRPIIGALNGLVAGAGAVIASACDLRIAAQEARIAFLFTKVGLSGADMGASWLLPRIVGQGRAMELLMTGDFIDADEALPLSVSTTGWCRATTMASEARRWARRLARGPSLGLEVTKKMVLREAAMDLERRWPPRSRSRPPAWRIPISVRPTMPSWRNAGRCLPLSSDHEPPLATPVRRPMPHCHSDTRLPGRSPPDPGGRPWNVSLPTFWSRCRRLSMIARGGYRRARSSPTWDVRDLQVGLCRSMTGAGRALRTCERAASFVRAWQPPHRWPMPSSPCNA